MNAKLDNISEAGQLPVPFSAKSEPDVETVLDGFHLHQNIDDDPYTDDRLPHNLEQTAEDILNGTSYGLLPNLRIVSFEEQSRGVDLDQDDYLMDWHYPGRNNVVAELPDLDFIDAAKANRASRRIQTIFRSA